MDGLKVGRSFDGAVNFFLISNAFSIFSLAADKSSCFFFSLKTSSFCERSNKEKSSKGFRPSHSLLSSRGKYFHISPVSCALCPDTRTVNEIFYFISHFPDI